MARNRVLRQASRGFWADTWHAVKVGALVLCLCVAVVAVVYAAPTVQSEWGIMG